MLFLRRPFQNSRVSKMLLLELILFFVLCQIDITMAVNDDYDYVKEVLEEDERHYGNDADHTTPEDLVKQQKAQAEQQRLAEEQGKADRIAAERERAFQKDLAKMNEDQKKAALRQKKRDARMVRQILKAEDNQNLYQVLGMRNWNVGIPARQFYIGPLHIKLPGITIKQTTTKDIRKAFRTRTKQIHPDKNRDGRAKEAFIAVENAASILSDETSRKQYDKQLLLAREERHTNTNAIFVHSWTTVRHVFRAILAILGPFAAPAIVIGVLII
jgi:hypothetical protein